MLYCQSTPIELQSPFVVNFCLYACDYYYLGNDFKLVSYLISRTLVPTCLLTLYKLFHMFG